MTIADKLDFQGFVQKRIGFGKYQILLVLSLIVVQMTDGMQAISISLVTPILKSELNLTQNEVSTFTSMFYLGVGIGAILSGLQSNSQGRRPSLLFGIFIQVLSGLLLSLKVNFGWLCFLRLLYGCGFGSTLAVATIVATQSLPMKYRGKTLLIINACNSFGKLLGVSLAFIFLQVEDKRWQSYMFTSTLPCLIAFTLCFFFVKESYRYMLSKQMIGSACQTINEIMMINHKNVAQMLTHQEQNEIDKWASCTFTKKQPKQNIWQLLLSDKRTLICLCLGWFFVNFVTFGELFIVPFLVQAKDEGLIKYFWMTLGELPSLLLTYTLIERQGFGRKMSLIIFYSISGIFCFFLFLEVNSFNLFLSKIVIKATFQMIYPFSSQSYPTKTRSVAFALNSAAGRIGSTIMPFILYPLYLSNSNAPFMMLAIGSFLGALSIQGVKQDTMQKALDQNHSQLQLCSQHSSKYQNSTEQQKQSI